MLPHLIHLGRIRDLAPLDPEHIVIRATDLDGVATYAVMAGSFVYVKVDLLERSAGHTTSRNVLVSTVDMDISADLTFNALLRIALGADNAEKYLSSGGAEKAFTVVTCSLHPSVAYKATEASPLAGFEKTVVSRCDTPQRRYVLNTNLLCHG